MTDYQQIVDRIREILASADQTQTEEMASLATEYVQWCRHANERLRQCQQYLLKGLRAEAVHVAEEGPALLDVVSALDFPEIAQWKELCLTYALPEPAPLQTETAKAVNEAYADVDALGQLLARHRLLGLARAPLSDHIAVL